MLLEAMACVPVLVLLWMMLKANPPPLFQAYSQPGKWYPFKRFTFYILLWLRRRKHQRAARRGTRVCIALDQGALARPDSPSGEAEAGYGHKSRVSAHQMEQPQTLSDDPQALDGMYFNGLHKDGTCFILRIGRRHGRKAEVWLSINIPEVGFFQSRAHPDTAVYNTDGRSFSAAGLRFECLEPMRRWKVIYNGMLRKGLNNEWNEQSEDLAHVKFSFIWEAFTDPFDFDTDNDPGQLASAVARETWSSDFWARLKERHQTHYEQWGELRGVLQVEGHTDKTLLLRGVRDHSYGVRDWRSFHRYVVHFGYLEDGTTFHVNTVSMPECLSYLQCGYLCQSNGALEPVSWTDIDLPQLGEELCPPDKYTFSFSAGGKQYDVEMVAKLCPMYYHHEDWGNVIFEKVCTFTVNDIPGFGVTEFCYRRHNAVSPVPPQQSSPVLQVPKIQLADQKALTLTFSQPLCRSAELVGGKGCQLAWLKQFDSKSYEIPDGFCLTIAAFHQQLQEHPELREKITQLQEVCRGGVLSDIQPVCQLVVSAFKNTPLSLGIQQDVAKQLINLFPGDHGSRLFAVRSSATGEDSEEMSAAGQMDTLLGIKGTEAVFESICCCWASNFAVPAVEYRRQHGQAILCPMGVVLQEMVPADAAGVLFTVDPVTGHTGTMLLNANYGLGESVVSGGADPDTVRIARGPKNSLRITERYVGDKKTQVKMQESGGIQTLSVDRSEGSQCCLSEYTILRLAVIGLEVESKFTDPRDIEWAMRDDKIYLLQARPITTLTQESDWELVHEFDTPWAFDRELFTTCNIGEMMPGVMTPLTLSTFLRSIDIAGQDFYKRVGVRQCINYPYQFVASFANHGFLNVQDMASINERTMMSGDKKTGELAVMGELLEDFSLDEAAQYSGTFHIWTRAVNSLRMFLTLSGAHKSIEKLDARLRTDSIADHDHHTAADLYRHINTEAHKLPEAWTDSMKASASSGTWATVLMSIISQGKPEWTNEYYADVALLLSKCDNVYSADVPSAIQRLAVALQDLDHGETFTNLSSQEAVKWLQSADSGEAGVQFKAFLTSHGHRCVKEAEFREKSWQTEPSKIITVLQSMLRSGSTLKVVERSEVSVKDAIKGMKSETTFIGRLILQWAVKKARAAVGKREWGKSTTIKMTEVFKLAYWKLARLMVHEGRLPDEDLLFFFTHQELGVLLQTRSARMVSRAQRRRRVFNQQASLTFPRICRGYPQPMKEDAEDDQQASSFKVTGMPVGQGFVRGTARVVTSLQEASSIQQGDILIVKFTDVGWTPYFPLISGLVTEVGGLVSHGAVVAREYGLPCIVKVLKATKIFKSGDQVLLNGTKGTIEKLE